MDGGAAGTAGTASCEDFVGVVGVEGSRKRQGVDVVAVGSPPTAAPPACKTSCAPPACPPSPVPPSNSKATAVKELKDRLRPRSCES